MDSLEYLDNIQDLTAEGYTFRKLVAHASVAFNSTPAQIVGQNRMREPTKVRHAIMWCLREMGWTFPTIAKLFVRDHTSVIHGVSRFQDALTKKEPWAQAMAQELMAPGTLLKLKETMDEMQTTAQVEMRLQKIITEKDGDIAILRDEAEELRHQVRGLLATVANLSRERDLYFAQKQDIGVRYNEKRNRLIAIQKHAEFIASKDHPDTDDLIASEIEYIEILDDYAGLIDDILPDEDAE